MVLSWYQHRKLHKDNNPYLQTHLSLQHRELIITAIGTNSISDMKHNSHRDNVVTEMTNLITEMKAYTNASQQYLDLEPFP